MREPDFANLLAVLRGERPSRPTLFEFFLNDRLYRSLAEGSGWERGDDLDVYRMLVAAFRAAGYDYATVHGSSFHFPMGEIHQQQTRSLNEGGLIVDRPSFERYQWPDPAACDYSALGRIAPELPAGMKLLVCGPCGVLENAIQIVGYDRLCFIMADDPALAGAIFDEVGSRLVGYYEQVAGFDTVGALISNDDWGFKTQTMLSPRDMRRYVFPWHRRIVAVAHDHGKPAILHSCGQLEAVMEDIIEDMRFDGKHSYEDNILPVEQAYERWGGRIGILGGMDLHFVISRPAAEVTARSRRMLERAAERGGYALGTGNSVPEFVPDEQYFAMTKAALE